MYWAFMKRSVTSNGRNALCGLRDFAPRVIMYRSKRRVGRAVTVTVRLTSGACCGLLYVNTSQLASDYQYDHVKTGSKP